MDREHEANIESTVLDQGTFGASRTTLQSLVEEAKKSDFAVLVLSADDMVESRHVVGKAPRDNVVFELGLFMGVIGTERVFILPPRRGPSCRRTSVDSRCSRRTRRTRTTTSEPP
ncbi:TIR domain-containing protein [Cellulosimicrobium cellulans]|uniref:TIR domain-containing protein n=1 Tax=Cellulosimicrobium cellulans TaxID=1710 RepID=UPI0037F65453